MKDQHKFRKGLFHAFLRTQFKACFCHLNIFNGVKCSLLPDAVCIKLKPPFQFFYLEGYLIVKKKAAAKHDRVS